MCGREYVWSWNRFWDCARWFHRSWKTNVCNFRLKWPAKWLDNLERCEEAKEFWPWRWCNRNGVSQLLESTTARGANVMPPLTNLGSSKHGIIYHIGTMATYFFKIIKALGRLWLQSKKLCFVSLFQPKIALIFQFHSWTTISFSEWN